MPCYCKPTSPRNMVQNKYGVINDALCLLKALLPAIPTPRHGGSTKSSRLHLSIKKSVWQHHSIIATVSRNQCGSIKTPSQQHQGIFEAASRNHCTSMLQPSLVSAYNTTNVLTHVEVLRLAYMAHIFRFRVFIHRNGAAVYQSCSR